MADEKRAVPYSKGKALADEYGVLFFETSAKENINVEEVGVLKKLTFNHPCESSCRNLPKAPIQF